MIEINQSEIDADGWDLIQEFMDAQAEAWNRAESELAHEFGISEPDAANILYLRTRSRWTKQIEDRIISAAQNGVHINTLGTDKSEDEQLREAGY